MEENKEEKVNSEAKTEIKKEKPKKNKTNKELENAKKEIESLKDKVLRVTAEMQNMHRRQDEEISRIQKYEGNEILKKLLPIVDNFERAIKLDDTDLTDELSKFLSGFKMIYTNLVNVMKECEVKEIECSGENFDASTMEAVLTEHVEGLEKGKVVEVLQKGYMYKDKLLRPAMVKVSE